MVIREKKLLLQWLSINSDICVASILEALEIKGVATLCFGYLELRTLLLITVRTWQWECPFIRL